MDYDVEIKRIKKRLINKVLKGGMYENFGQREYRGLMDKYGSDFYSDSDLRGALMAFDNWAMNYTGE